MKRRKGTYYILVLLLLLFVTLLFARFVEYISLENAEQYLETEIQKEVSEKDNLEKVDDEKYNVSEPQTECVEGVPMIVLSDKELEHIEMAIIDYYISINCKISGFLQVDSAPFIQKYEGYETDEVVIFEVFVEDSENRRYIAIGSKDNWKDCSILNEGY